MALENINNSFDSNVANELANEFLKDKAAANKHFNENRKKYAEEWVEMKATALDDPKNIEHHEVYKSEQRRAVDVALEGTNTNLQHLVIDIENFERQVAIEKFIEQQRLVVQRLFLEAKRNEEIYEKVRKDLILLNEQYIKNKIAFDEASIAAAASRKLLTVIELHSKPATKQVAEFYREPKNGRINDNSSNRFTYHAGWGYETAAKAALDADRSLEHRVESLSKQAEKEPDALKRERIQVQMALEINDFRALQNYRISSLYDGDKDFIAKARNFDQNANAMALRAADLDLKLEERGFIMDFTRNEIDVREIQPHEMLHAQGLNDSLSILEKCKNQKVDLENAEARQQLASSQISESKQELDMSKDGLDKAMQVSQSTRSELSIEHRKLKSLESETAVAANASGQDEEEAQSHSIGM